MTQTDNSSSQPTQASMIKRMLVGAGIGLVFISFFLLTADEPNPEWGKLWMLRPLLLVPFAGAIGGLCNYYIIHFYTQAGINKIVAMLLTVIVFIVGLFMGFVLGLDGTMWD